MRSDSRSALTLVELLIVIAILSVLTAIALPVTKDLIEENKIKESVRTVQSFMEMARSKAIASGREHAVELIRSDSQLPDLSGTVREIKIGVGMPNYRGDIDGALCWLFHASTTDNSAVPLRPLTPPLATQPKFANCAIFRKSECPSLAQTLATLKAAQSTPNILNNVHLSIDKGDYFVFDGIELPIIGFNETLGSETPFNTGAIAGLPIDYLKIYFDPSVAIPPPTLPSGEVWKRTFEIKRSGIREGQTTLTLPRGAAIDLYYSGISISGQEFSPIPSKTNYNLTLVFSPSGTISRILGTNLLDPRIPKDPTSLIYFLVGRADQVRADLAAFPTLPIDDPRALTNVVDTRATWLMVNPHNGRISTSPVRNPIAGPNALAQLIHSRKLAIQPQEQE